MTIPEGSTSTPIQRGDGDDGAASVGDVGEAAEQVAAPETTDDGAGGQDAGQAAPESSPVPALEERDHLVEVLIDADGNGQAMCGIDPDYVAGARLVNARGSVSFGAAHTIAITRVTVTGSNVAEGGTALVAVTPK